MIAIDELMIKTSHYACGGWNRMKDILCCILERSTDFTLTSLNDSEHTGTLDVAEAVLN